MATTWSPFPQKSLQIKKKDGRFFSKNLSREFSMTHSLEDYHGGASAAVPFTWESEPGTPKVKFRETSSLPPLTPPPSYYSTAMKRPSGENRGPKILRDIFPKRNSRKSLLPSSPVSSSSSSSTSFPSSPWSRSYSAQSSPIATPNSHRRNRISSLRLSFDSRMDGEEQEYELPVSALGFSRRQNGRARGCYSSIIKVLLRHYKD